MSAGATRVCLGEGAFGRVYSGDDASRAYKVVPLTRTTNITSLVREVRLLVELRHPNVLRGLDWSVHNRELSIEMARYDATLHECKDRVKASKAVRRHYMRSIACGLAYLHALNVIHRDLKPQNVLVKWVDGGADEVVIGDLGMARKYVHGDPSSEADDILSTYVVTRWYRAPEVVLYIQCEAPPYTCAMDAWSLGCVFYEMVVGWAKFDGQTPDEHWRLLEAFAPETGLGEIADGDERALVAGLLQKQPDERARARDVAKALGAESTAYIPVVDLTDESELFDEVQLWDDLLDESESELFEESSEAGDDSDGVKAVATKRPRDRACEERAVHRRAL